MKIVKGWYKLPFPDNQKIDLEENALGELRSKWSDKGDWSMWRSKLMWGAQVTELINTTPPTIDYTRPNEDQVKGLEALKKWMNE